MAWQKTGIKGGAHGVVCLLLVLGGLAGGCVSEDSSAPVTETPDTTGYGAAAQPAPAPDDPRTVAERLQDATLAAEIRKALLDTLDLRPFDFEPEVVQGRVVLRGIVRTATQRTLAETIVREVAGVQTLVSEVLTAADTVRADPDTLLSTGTR